MRFKKTAERVLNEFWSGVVAVALMLPSSHRATLKTCVEVLLADPESAGFVLRVLEATDRWRRIWDSR